MTRTLRWVIAGSRIDGAGKVFRSTNPARLDDFVADVPSVTRQHSRQLRGARGAQQAWAAVPARCAAAPSAVSVGWSRTTRLPWPMVVTPTADLQLAVEGALFSGFGAAGQRGTSLGTVIVHHSVHDEFLAAFAEATASARIGDTDAERALRAD